METIEERLAKLEPDIDAISDAIEGKTGYALYHAYFKAFCAVRRPDMGLEATREAWVFYIAGISAATINTKSLFAEGSEIIEKELMMTAFNTEDGDAPRS